MTPAASRAAEAHAITVLSGPKHLKELLPLCDGSMYEWPDMEHGDLARCPLLNSPKVALSLHHALHSRLADSWLP